MVDIDRVREKLSGDESGKTKKSGDGRDKKSNKKEDKELTKEQKLDLLKGGSGGKPTSSGGGTEDIKKLLFALGNLDLYTRMISEYEFEGVDKASRNVKDSISSDFVGEVTNFLGVFNVGEIAGEYGYSWGDIVTTISNNKDMDGRTMNTNSGSVKKKDIKDLLECIANIVLYVEGSYHHVNDMDSRNRREEVTLVVSEAIHDYYQEILSNTEVQKIAEVHGYDWEDDILRNVLENQDFESKIKN